MTGTSARNPGDADREARRTAPDLGDPATYDHGPPFAEWDRMRAVAPVLRTRSAFLDCDFWSVVGWTEIRAVLGDDALFASRYGVFPGFGPEAPDPAGQRMLVVTDGDHRRALRAAMQRFFSPRWARRFSADLTEIFRAALLPRLGDPSLDFAQEVAWRVPMAATCRLLGLPERDEARLCSLANGVLTSQDPHIAPDRAAALASGARTEIIAYFHELVAQRREAPGDDVASALIGDLGDGELPAEDVVLNLLSLLVAANETTRLALTGALVAFADFPAQWARLRAEPSLAKEAVEEILRWTSPGLGVNRTASQDTLLGTVRLRAGDVVTVWLPAGNRDPGVYEEPHVFDIARQGPSPVAFGHGPHHCIGAALARVEIGALLAALLPVTGEITVAGPLAYTHSSTLTGLSRAPLLLFPADGRD